MLRGRFGVGLAVLLLVVVVVAVGCSGSETPSTEQGEQGPAEQHDGESAQGSTAPVHAVALADADEDVAELRVWQAADDPDVLWVGGRLSGETGGKPVRDLLDTTCWFSDYSDGSHFRYGRVNVTVEEPHIHEQGVVLHVYQQVDNPERMFVQACSGDCLDFCGLDPCPGCYLHGPWRPLGMTPLTFVAGEGEEGGMRIADLRIAVPRDNPGLLRDREHLLALRDVLDGGSGELEWSVGTPTTSWEGVRVSGSPPRVTGLNLSGRGLDGELWGYIGDLTELEELRLDGNRLSGVVPSKMQLLSKLSTVRLAGNDLKGCTPPGLWQAADHDLDDLDVPRCGVFREGISADRQYFTHFIRPRDPTASTNLHIQVVDVPPPWLVLQSLIEPGEACELEEAPADIFEAADCGTVTGYVFRRWGQQETWLFFDPTGQQEIARSHYPGFPDEYSSDSSPMAWIEQLAASSWVNESSKCDYESQQLIWIWP